MITMVRYEYDDEYDDKYDDEHDHEYAYMMTSMMGGENVDLNMDEKATW